MGAVFGTFGNVSLEGSLNILSSPTDEAVIIGLSPTLNELDRNFNP